MGGQRQHQRGIGDQKRPGDPPRDIAQAPAEDQAAHKPTAISRDGAYVERGHGEHALAHGGGPGRRSHAREDKAPAARRLARRNSPRPGGGMKSGRHRNPSRIIVATPAASLDLHQFRRLGGVAHMSRIGGSTISYKTILVHCDASNSVGHRLAVAAHLAQRFGARLVGLHVRRPFELAVFFEGGGDGRHSQELRGRREG